LSCPRDILDLLSFPTRRSSDLWGRGFESHPLHVQGVTTMLPRTSGAARGWLALILLSAAAAHAQTAAPPVRPKGWNPMDFKKARDRKSTRLNSSHLVISYAVFC